MSETLIETPRLLMRNFTPQDAAAVFQFNSNSQVTRFTGDAGKVQSVEDAEHVIRNTWMAEREQFGYSRMAMIHKQDGKVIGFAGLKFLPEEDMPDLGYRMLPDYWGQGFGYEAAKACLDFAFKDLALPQVMALAMVDNHGSNRILQKLKFNELGQQSYHGEEVYRYEMNAQEYRARHG